MKRTEIHRRALRGAAAVAFTIGLVGCGGRIAEEPMPTPTTPSSPDPKTETGTIVVDAAEEVVSEVAIEDSAPETAADAGCRNPASSTEWDCCQLPDDTTDLACCKAHGWFETEHCTPWGPPVPPRMVHSNEIGVA